MLYYIDNFNCLRQQPSNWFPNEFELENLVFNKDLENENNSNIFFEKMLFIKNQVSTSNKKRADILALDGQGNSVIIELKRDKGQLGIETQSLQYLANFSQYKGLSFIDRFSKDCESLADKIDSFYGNAFKKEDINKNSRIILIAQQFDPSLFSMGEWLSSKGVAFRCIEYTPIEIEGKRFINFSVAFDRTPESLFPLAFDDRNRNPGMFWHNIGRGSRDLESNKWWEYLIKEKTITASFECIPGDQGERILRSYVAGDTVIAYAGGYGAVGWGKIEKPQSYVLLKPGDKQDILGGHHLHRLNISWKTCAKSLEDAISPERLKNEFGIIHPRSTRVSIDPNKGKRLMEEMTKQYGEFKA